MLVIGWLAVVALLATAAILAFAGLVYEVRLHRAHAAYRRQLDLDLARDRIIHDRLGQLPLPEEADDYIDAWERDSIRPIYDSEASSPGPWRTYLRPPTTLRVRTRGGRAGSG